MRSWHPGQHQSADKTCQTQVLDEGDGIPAPISSASSTISAAQKPTRCALAPTGWHLARFASMHGPHGGKPFRPAGAAFTTPFPFRKRSQPLAAHDAARSDSGGRRRASIRKLCDGLTRLATRLARPMTARSKCSPRTPSLILISGSTRGLELLRRILHQEEACQRRSFQPWRRGSRFGPRSWAAISNEPLAMAAPCRMRARYATMQLP